MNDTWMESSTHNVSGGKHIAIGSSLETEETQDLEALLRELNQVKENDEERKAQKQRTIKKKVCRRNKDYYKNAEDLNLPEQPTRDATRREKPARSERHSSGAKRGQRVRLKLNLGTRQNATTRSILGAINEVTNDKSISIGDIEITHKFTFFDVFADQADKVLDAFAHSGGPLEVTVVETRDRDDKRPFRSDKKQTARSDSRRAKDRSHSRSSERSSRRRDDNSAVVNSEKPWRRKRY